MFPNPHVWIIRQDEAEKAEASAAVAVPVAGPSSLNSTVTLPSSPEFLATKKGKKLPNPNCYNSRDLRWDDSTEEATMPNKSIPTLKNLNQQSEGRQHGYQHGTLNMLFKQISSFQISKLVKILKNYP